MRHVARDGEETPRPTAWSVKRSMTKRIKLIKSGYLTDPLVVAVMLCQRTLFPAGAGSSAAVASISLAKNEVVIHECFLPLVPSYSLLCLST